MGPPAGTFPPGSGASDSIEPEREKMKDSRRKSGFTLVEVMVVAVIVAILAAVAIPLMSANKTRAIATEAEAALGTIRSALRAMYAETGNYTLDLDGQPIDTTSITSIPGIGPGDLNGRWFSEECYSLTVLGPDSYTITARGSATLRGEPMASDIANVEIRLDQDGNFTRVSGF